MTEIRKAASDDLAMLYRLSGVENHVTESGYFERCLQEQESGSREVMLIFKGGDLAGYAQYQKNPQYQPFRSLGIPEIQDLYILPDFRRNGLAVELIKYCENKALSEGHDMIGIGVGLYSNYGKAQRLYVKMGYEPDGGGIVYERKAVMPGQLYKVDDELCLMMIKRLN
ncbi:MAG: N-acetyltransferase [Micavibrio aeruginosavorus]|uniref:N-acetyltransferase n=1 Tax=Micavibrio aeruginosavorus TaxID=349221 RepID=A0A2W5FSV8_9BACT|nr:MAG: N-acetyltransferase [Micavibrio aeruginosavorus]